MKLIATKDFANVPALGLKVDVDGDGKHDKHVNKGHRFSIGSTDVWEDLKAEEKEKIGHLLHSQCVIYDNDANKSKVAKIDKEVASDKEALKKRSETKPLTVADQIALGVAAALKELGVVGKVAEPKPAK